jgi:N5-(cytidine 5'-diphosphoramidyl)-L-glutamine hydrolase
VNKAVGITQRSLARTEFGEQRYGLDRRWFSFLAGCGLVAVPLPNIAEVAVDSARALGLRGIVFSGGDDLAAYGGQACGRDETERALLGWATDTDVPVLGVCRGAQLLLDAFGVRLVPVEGHVATRHVVNGDTGPRTVNSYHRHAAHAVTAPLRTTATCGDVVEAFEHRDARVAGIMWHPEREDTAAAEDVLLFRTMFGVP